MRKFVLSLLTLVALASLADASGLFCRRCRRCHAVGVPCAVAVAAAVEVPVVQFRAIEVPTYSVTYTPIVQQITRQETYTTVPVATQVKTTVQEQTYGPPATVLFQASGQQVQGVSQVTNNYQAQSAAVVQGQIKQAVPQPSAGVDQPDKVEVALLEFLESRKRLKQIEVNLANCFNPAPVPPPVASPPGGVSAPVPPAGNPPQAQITPEQVEQYGQTVFAKSCVICHDPKSKLPDGVKRGPDLFADGKLGSIVDGKLVPITDRQLSRISTRTYLREMPPPNNKAGVQPLADEEVGVLTALVNQRQKVQQK